MGRKNGSRHYRTHTLTLEAKGLTVKHSSKPTKRRRARSAEPERYVSA